MGAENIDEAGFEATVIKGKKLPETGFYGDMTIRMVKAFQKFCNLAPSGMYEEKTREMVEWKFWNMLDNLDKQMKSSQP